VHDVTPPVVTCPANVTVNCQDSTAPANTGTANATDNCSPTTITFSDVSTQNPNPGVCGHNTYTITRTWTARDVCLNSASCGQTIHVQDVTAPVLTVPADVTIQCDESLVPGLPWGTVTGGVAIYYRNNGQGENPNNQSYLKTQYSATNSHGAAFSF